MALSPVRPPLVASRALRPWARLRPAAKQRPRTQKVEIRWHDLQELLRERDVLWHRAPTDLRTSLEAARQEYGRSYG